MKISASDRVQVWLQTLSPQTRRDLRAGLKLLSQGKGDVKALQRDLDGYYRLRVGAYRIIFRYTSGKSGPECFCTFAEARDVVYEQFAAILTEEGRV